VRGVFVTGTDTGVGKTVVAAAICAALTARGERVAAFKPVVTGTDDQPDPLWPPDHELLAHATGGGQAPGDVAPYTFGPAVSPHYAAELAGTEIDPASLRERACELSADVDALVCEGVGGLLVPLTDRYSVCDLAGDLDLPVVVVARSGLGTINHTRLTVEAARAAGLDVLGIVMTPWESPEPIEQSNRATVERLTRTRVSTLAPTTPATVAAAGERLPLDSWL
jgi:dethiobiotin synthetase